jgi:hypothetical protein
VIEAYYHPTVDDSTQKFEWGQPQLDSLRIFLMEAFGWSEEKADQVLLPVLREMNNKKVTPRNILIHKLSCSLFHRPLESKPQLVLSLMPMALFLQALVVRHKTGIRASECKALSIVGRNRKDLKPKSSFLLDCGSLS